MPRHHRSVSVSRLTGEVTTTAVANGDTTAATSSNPTTATTPRQIQHEIDAALAPLRKRAVLDHTLQFLPLGEFARAARVSWLWHGVTVGGGESTRVWKRGVRRGSSMDSGRGEIGVCKGRRLAFWSAMCNIRNCVADPSAGSLTRCLCDHERSRESGGAMASLLFDHEAGGDLAFRRRQGVFPRLEKWARVAATTDWVIALASKVSGEIARFRRRLGALDTGHPLDALFERVAVVARSYAGFVAVRAVLSSLPRTLSYPSVLISAVADLPRAADLVAGAERAVAGWLDAGAQAVPLVAMLLWETQHYSSASAPFSSSASLGAPSSSYDGGDPLVRQIENEDAFWTLAVLRESLWFDLQHMQNADNEYHDLRELLRRYTPSILAHLDAHRVHVGTFVSVWFASGFTALCAPGPIVFHIWDLFVTEGRKTLYRAAIQVLLDHKVMILQTKHRDSLLEILLGRSDAGERALRLDADKDSESSFVRRMLSLKVTRRMISALVLQAGQKMSVRAILPSSSSPDSAAFASAPASSSFLPHPGSSTRGAKQRQSIGEPIDASAEWRAKLESPRTHTMPPAPGVGEDHVEASREGIQGSRSLANLSGVSKDLRHTFFTKVEAVQALLRRPVQLSAVSSRLMHRMGAGATKDLLGRIDAEADQDASLSELKTFVLMEEMCMKLEEKIPELRPKWSDEAVKACADVLIRDNALAVLISLGTSRTRLEGVVAAFEETDGGGLLKSTGSTRVDGVTAPNMSGSIANILHGSRDSGRGDSAEAATNLRRAESRRRSIIARVPTSEESYYIESAGQLEGPFSRKEMRYWCDKRVVGPSAMLRIVVTDPRNFVLVPDLGPGVFRDAHGNHISECPFPDNSKHAPAMQASEVYPEWFRAFRTIPRVTSSSEPAPALALAVPSAASASPLLRVSLSSPDVVPPPPPPRRESFFTTGPEGIEQNLASPTKKGEHGQGQRRKQEQEQEQEQDDDDDDGGDDDATGQDELMAPVAIPKTPRAYHEMVHEHGLTSARASATLGQANMSEPAAARLLTVQQELGRSNEEVAALRAQLASIEEDKATADRLQSEVSQLKSVAVASRNTILRLETALMAATNRADEVTMQKKYEEEEVTSLLDSYRKDASDAKEAQRTQDTKIQELVSDLENSVFLERENDKLGTLLAEYTGRQRELEANIEETNAKARKLAVENIKLKRTRDGQTAYYENVAAEQERRDASLIERERKVTQRERDVETNLQEEFLKKMMLKNAQRIDNEAHLQREYAEDMEQLQQRLLNQFDAKMEVLRQQHEKEKDRLREEHATAAGRWDVERRRLEQNVHDEHAVSRLVLLLLCMCLFPPKFFYTRSRGNGILTE
jgi:hypothetical protein